MIRASAKALLLTGIAMVATAATAQSLQTVRGGNTLVTVAATAPGAIATLGARLAF